MGDMFEVWITKFALERGIFKARGYLSHDDRDIFVMVSTDQRGGTHTASFLRRYWHRTREAAIARAEEMRDNAVYEAFERSRELATKEFDDCPD